MRSYYAHLDTTLPLAAGAIASKPVFRSSAIFPVFQRADISSRVLFLGYWMLKRKIQQIGAVISLRSMKGQLLARRNMTIDQARCYRVELKSLLEQSGFPASEPFDGSLEIEFYSALDLVFPYPAVVINYYGPHFSSVVHTAQRVYNDYDDMIKNSETSVPESGFNLFIDSKREPIIALINGAFLVDEGQVAFEFYNSDGERLNYQLSLGCMPPYQAILVYPAKQLDLKNFFDGKPGFCRTLFNVEGIFPRLLVGNVERGSTGQEQGISVTHTYYDCSKAKNDSDYWSPSSPDWYPASLMVPAHCVGRHFTNISFYPIYSPSEIEISIEIYDQSGKLLLQKPKALTVNSPGLKLQQLHLKSILQDNGISCSDLLAARIIATPKEGSRMPARVKLGLDVGCEGSALPCNICTNLQPYNPKYEGKGRSFKWAPLIADQAGACFWIMNSTPQHAGITDASVELTFFREDDELQLKRELILPPNGFLCIDVDNDKELAEFLSGKTGWCTVVTSNPYLTTYYFTESLQGAIGGDHGF